MLVLVTGSRDWPPSTLRDVAQEMLCQFDRMPSGTVVMHGGARGVDDLAGVLARFFGLTERKMPVTSEMWRKHGKRAGPMRNIAMLDECPDLVLAFWNQKSNGTEQCFTEAQRRGIETRVLRF
jgi:hypothetical protein